MEVKIEPTQSSYNLRLPEPGPNGELLAIYGPLDVLQQVKAAFDRASALEALLGRARAVLEKVGEWDFRGRAVSQEWGQEEWDALLGELARGGIVRTLTEAEVRAELLDLIREDNALDSTTAEEWGPSHYVCWRPWRHNEITMDGDFTTAEIEAIVWWIANHREPKA